MDKGVLILSGYLGGKYGGSMPLSLSATLTFEQSYSFVEGDSASSTELFAILSSLSELPIKQGIAVTGSVNQWGEIQPIGGVNQKIEGFFDKGMEILTGVEAGERGKDGSFPENTVSARVQSKLKYLMKEQVKLKKEAEEEAE